MQFLETPSYLAPEVYQKKAYDEKIDFPSEPCFGRFLRKKCLMRDWNPLILCRNL